ncbi:MAG: SPOR domain-containing protein [Gammaproteobacteria bacterium]|nr:SPOR domain-containing protein [Gammaproteobacteria bacterium]
MSFTIRLSTLLLLAAVAWPAAATLPADSVIASLQSPAWIERNGEREALEPGVLLQAGDVLRTGPGGRIQAELSEGSLLKLGEEASLATEELVQPVVRAAATPAVSEAESGKAVDSEQPAGIFQATLNVLKGAFRFTTQLVGKQQKRSVDVRFGAVTAGIRGTDIWGKSGPDRHFVVLLEGSIEVTAPGAADPIRLESPLQGVSLTAGASAAETLTFDLPTVQQLAPETELQPGSGVQSRDGRWYVQLASLQQSSDAEQLRAALAQAGYPADVLPVDLDGRRYHRVGLGRLLSAADARAVGEQLTGRFGIEGFWVLRR